MRFAGDRDDYCQQRRASGGREGELENTLSGSGLAGENRHTGELTLNGDNDTPVAHHH